MLNVKLCFVCICLLPKLCFGKVFLADGVIHYHGDVNQQNTAKLIQLVNDSNVSKIQITSKGGAVAEGLSLASFVKSRNLSVHVPEFCFSSCANYVVSAAHQFSLGNNAVVAWHGGVFQLLNVPSSNSYYLSELFSIKNSQHLNAFIQQNSLAMMMRDTELLQREFQFMKNVGLSSGLLIYGQFTQNYEASGLTSAVWSFTDEALKSIFTNFIYNEARNTESPYNETYQIHFFHEFKRPVSFKFFQ